MKPLPVFQFKSYKTWLEMLFMSSENRGLMSRICRDIDCQRSYLSRIISSKLQLTPDYAYKISQALRLEPPEQEYFLLLVDYERCSDNSFRQFLSKKLQKLKSEHAEVAEKVQRPRGGHAKDDVLYFSAWYWSAIHMWCSSPGKHTVDSVSKKFSLESSIVERCLEYLTESGFLEKSGGHYKYLTGAMHVDRQSPLAHWHHSNWRQKALQDAQSLNDSSLHFSNLQTLTKSDFQRIRTLMLELIEKSEKIARPSQPEELFAICLDAFIVHASS